MFTVIVLIIVTIAFFFSIGLITTMIKNYKNNRLKSILSLCDPNAKHTQLSIKEAFNANTEYVTTQVKRLIPREGVMEISASSFVLQHKKRDPFLVHDVLHSTAKYLSTLTDASIVIVYNTSFRIRRKTHKGATVTIEKEKDQMIALCVHWFIWKYSSNPYALDQSFQKISATTNLIFGRMYGYCDVKEYDCSVDCWERYSANCGYTRGKTNGVEFSLHRSKTKSIHVSPMSFTENKGAENINQKTFRDLNQILISRQIDTKNLFYHIIPDSMEKECFSNDLKSMKRLIAPFGAKSDWGNNFDAWFFVYSVFLTIRFLRNKVADYDLDKYKQEFLSECELLKISLADLNLDQYSFEALGGIINYKDNTSIGYGSLYTNLEPYMERRFKEVFLDIQNDTKPGEKIEYAAILSFWNYLLFGSYRYITKWNQAMATVAINSSLEKIMKYSNSFNCIQKTVGGHFDPSLN